jgi:hypothetical protein
MLPLGTSPALLAIFLAISGSTRPTYEGPARKAVLATNKKGQRFRRPFLK